MSRTDRKTVYDFTLPALNGGEIDLSQWRGRPLIIINTASKCGFTPQYEALQKLWSKLCETAPEGPVIIGVPSGDFGGQEFVNAHDIWGFCEKNYGVTFPMTARSVVRGAEAVPLFRWLTEEGGIFSRPRWNFYKYLINREGHLQTWFSPLTAPSKGRFQRAVHRLMQQP